MPDPVAGDGEAVIAVKAASVNLSDLKSVAGQVKRTSLPRVPGRDFAGVVVDGPQDRVGAEVWGTGGDVGLTRDGSHAQMLAVPAAAAVGTRSVEIDLVPLYRNEIRVYGCNSGHYDVVESGARLQRVAPFFDSGGFRPLPIANHHSLENGQDAYLAVENRMRGRVVIRP
ncbi:alcohol dehydrogenase catalytic domain-containing protein [Streptomyces sp. NPDC014889]|uniref:alcohol dehydrogenase catalytic domain-containing protein n=1 Tax=Streptomyces sp. NPDC014889 TaxID=3364928 RepID=UPI0036FA2803